jgi:hypothetical protein
MSGAYHGFDDSQMSAPANRLQVKGDVSGVITEI